MDFQEKKSLPEPKARDYAMRLLSQRAYTEQGLYQKLCRRTEEEIARAVVLRMEELGLIDDVDYAERYIADCVNRKGWGKRRIAMELARKGIDRDLADELLELGCPEDQKPQIARVILKRYRACLDDEKGVKKATNALLRLGYRYTDIRTVMNDLNDDIDYYSDEDEW